MGAVNSPHFTSYLCNFLEFFEWVDNDKCLGTAKVFFKLDVSTTHQLIIPYPLLILYSFFSSQIFICFQIFLILKYLKLIDSHYELFYSWFAIESLFALYCVLYIIIALLIFRKFFSCLFCFLLPIVLIFRDVFNMLIEVIGNTSWLCPNWSSYQGHQDVGCRKRRTPHHERR